MNSTKQQPKDDLESNTPPTTTATLTPTNPSKTRKKYVVASLVLVGLALGISLVVVMNDRDKRLYRRDFDDDYISVPKSQEELAMNAVFFEQVKLDVSLPKFSADILSGYSTCDNLQQDVEQALNDYANDIIKNEMDNFQAFYYGIAFDGEMVAMDETESSFMSKSSGEMPAEEDSFGTNNQHNDVDEADIVKSDGTYVYAVYGSKIVVLEVLGNEVYRLDIEEIDKDNTVTVERKKIDYYSNSIRGLLLYENRLIAITTGYDYSYTSISSDMTLVIVMDIDSSTGALSVVEKQILNGSFAAARMIDSNAHIVTTSYIHHWEFEKAIRRHGTIYDGLNDTEYASLAFEEATKAIPKYSERLLKEILSQEVSITVSDNDVSTVCQNIAKLSITPTNEFSGIQGVLNGMARVLSFDIPSGLKSSSFAAAFVPSYYADVYASSDMLFIGGRGWAMTPIEQQESLIGTEVTYITAFQLNEASATPKAMGIIPGYTLNQFSFDYYDDHLRVATTTNEVRVWHPQTHESDLIAPSTNQVVVAQIQENEIQIVGMLEDLGLTERIFAIRFMGELAFMVTFRQTDPFYTIDLSVPEKPVMRGELKIPGFSNYLHPVDDDYILAVGQDADENGRPLGVQIALFDVSDIENPLQSSKFVIPEWSSSESQYDHQAFRYLPLSQKLILPISLSKFDGFHVYDINPKNLVGKQISFDFEIAHYNVEEPHAMCYSYDYLSPRSLVFQGDVMTLKGHSVLRHDLGSGERLHKEELDSNLTKEIFCNGWY